MVLILVVVILQLLFSWLYFTKRSMRDERGKLINILVVCCLSVIIASFARPSFDSPVALFYAGTIGVCIITLSLIYVRNIFVERRTSGYLILLAVFPFILFIVFLLLYAGYETQILDSIVHYYLNWMFHQGKNVLLALVVLYELSLLYAKRNQLSYYFSSLDGQLGFLFVALKLALVAFVFLRAFFVGVETIVEFPVQETALLFLIGIYYTLYFKGLHIAVSKYRKIILPDAELKSGYAHQTTVRTWNNYIATADKYILEKRLFRMKNFHIRDLAAILEIDPKNLSIILEQGLGISFEDYLDKHRIRYFVDHCQHIDCSAKGILNLANEAGFANKYKFYRAFRKQYSVDPREYLRRMDFSMT